MTTEEKFLAAVDVINSLPKNGPFQPSYDLTMKFQAYYKQATHGPCTTPKPSFFDRKKYEWYAWKSLGDMPREIAMQKYIEELSKVIETMSYTEAVSKFIDLMGPFYEIVWPEELENTQKPADKEISVDQACDSVENKYSIEPAVTQRTLDEISNVITCQDLQESFEVISHQSLAAETVSTEQVEVRHHEHSSSIMNAYNLGVREFCDPERTHTATITFSDTFSSSSSSSCITASDVLPLLLNLQKSLDKMLGHMDRIELLVKSYNQKLDKTRRREPEGKRRTLTPFAVALVVLWPFIVHWVVYVIRKQNVHRKK